MWNGISALDGSFHHVGVLNLDQAVFDHLVQCGQKFIDFLRALNELDSHGHVFAAHLLAGRMDDFMGTETGDWAESRGPGDALMPEKAENRAPERIHVAPGVFVHIDGDLLRRATGQHVRAILEPARSRARSQRTPAIPRWLRRRSATDRRSGKNQMRTPSLHS